MSTSNVGIGFQIKEKLAALQDAILAAHPTMPTLLREIHTQLRADKSIVTLMSPEEISIVVNGLKRQTNTELIVATMKGSGSRSGGKKGMQKSFDASEL